MNEVIREVTLATIEKLDEIIATREEELKNLYQHRSRLVTEACIHDIKDLGFENGHNGDWVSWFECNKCHATFKNIEGT